MEIIIIILLIIGIIYFSIYNITHVNNNKDEELSEEELQED